MLKVVGLFVLMASALSKELDGKPSGGGTVQQRLFKPEHDEESRFSVIKDEEVNANETKNESSQGGNTSKIRARRRSYRPCGQRRYNANFDMCCDGKIVSRSGLRPACCRTQGYDAKFDMCCGGKIVSRSGLRPACCRTQGYDAKFDMCCGGNIVSRSGLRPACCRTQGYDAKFDMCCGGNIVSRSGFRPACCGTRGYDASFNSCCSGRVC